MSEPFGDIKLSALAFQEMLSSFSVTDLVAVIRMMLKKSDYPIASDFPETAILTVCERHWNTENKALISALSVSLTAFIKDLADVLGGVSNIEDRIKAVKAQKKADRAAKKAQKASAA